MASPTEHALATELDRRRGWGRERDGKYQYQSPTRLWEFEPRQEDEDDQDDMPLLLSSYSRNHVDDSRGKWRYEHGGFWVDWNPYYSRTTLLLQDEELPPEQFQIMGEVQKYNSFRIVELEKEKNRLFRQARIDLERERIRADSQCAPEKQRQQQQQEVEEIAHATTPDEKSSRKNAKGMSKRLISKITRFRTFIKRLPRAPSSAAPRIVPSECREFIVAPEDEPLILRSEAFRKRLSLMELEIEDDYRSKILELEYILLSSVPADMILGAPEVW